MADDKEVKDFGDIDDWLADLDDDDQESPAAEAAAEADDDELDQSDIDQLLSGANEGDGGDQDDSVELDQADIDSLFGDSSEEVPTPAAKPEESPPEEPAAEAREAEPEPDGNGVDQPTAATDQEAAAADDDDIFAAAEDAAEDADDAAGAAAPSEEMAADAPEQSADAGGDEDFAGADWGGGDETAAPAAAGQEEKDPFDFDEGDFDIDGFDFDEDIPEIPDENVLSAAKDEDASAATEDEDIFADTPDPGTMTAGEEGEGEEKQGLKKTMLGWLPASLSSFDRSNINKSTIGASLFALLILVGAAYFLLGREDEPELAIPPLVREQMVEALEPERPELDQPPRAREELFRMEERGAAVSMQLRAEAADGAPLAYEIVRPPRHGRLSGEPPRVTYLPNPDFPGEDSFVFRATDGRQASEPARVSIVGQSLRAEVAADEVTAAVDEVTTLAPERAWVRARDLTLTTRSTEELEIDWQAIWRRDNAAPFAGARVEIVEQNLTGRLTSPGTGRHRYRPDPYFQGQESLLYRFHYAGQRSKPRRLTLRVELGDPPPSIRLQPLAEAYPAGETVIIDARQTRAVRPQELRFEWRQLSGSGVKLEPLTDNDSVVRFVSPAPFSHLASPGVVLQVTAIDPAGQRDSRTVEVKTPSRRQSSLWTGEAENRGSPLWGY